MSLSLLKHFPKDSQPYLAEIAERLWAGHAAIMIGAGFSCNAIKNDFSKKGFPNWNQLGDVFHQKLYGVPPENNQHYLNVLKMADEVQAAFGRPVLDQLVISNIPDEDHSPSSVQVKMLELPWTDIFTTNYDTLLERASQSVINYKYNLVLNQADLIYAEKPRIIKLHGSFPSERPFIVTEEDYRRYPMDFAPFVNTVQQSLLENTFCLIGFSADDPNFLRWIGWISDNLGRDHSPKLYLVGILKLTDAQKKLLTSRNIVIVNLVETDSEIGHTAALNNFVDFLADQRKKDLNINWPGKISRFDVHRDLDLTKLIKDWSRIRKSYPNWVIFPYPEVEKFWDNTSSAVLASDKIMDQPEGQDIDYLFELNWRLERCLIPVFNEFQKSYEHVLEKYENQPPHKEKWIELAFSLWRFYREEGFLELWRQLADKIAGLSLKSGEYIARYYYEKCLYHIALHQLKELKNNLNYWPVNEVLPFWETKRAGLLAEIGLTNEAIGILENALAIVRRRSLRTDSTADYTWVSQEAYIMQLLNYTKKSEAFRNNDFASFEADTSFYDRQNLLKLYKCDPWLELGVFDLKLQQDITEPRIRQVNYGFNLSSVSTTYRLAGRNDYLINAYQFLRYLEEAGIPPHLPNMTYGLDDLRAALKRTATYSSFWTVSALIRAADNDTVDKVLSRDVINKLPESTISALIEHLIQIEQDMFAGQDDFEILNEADRNSVIPLILGKLVVRSTPNQQRRLVELLLEHYRSDNRSFLSGDKELLEGLISSMTNSLKFEMLPTFLKFPIAEGEDRRELWPDPFDYFRISNRTVSNGQIVTEPSVIQSLFNSAVGGQGKRKKAINRLAHLWDLDQLSQKEKKEFGKILWSYLDTSGFPADTNFLKYSFLSLPHPDKIDPEIIFREYILNYTPFIQSNSTKSGISMSGGNMPQYQDLVNGTKKSWTTYGVSWTEAEALIIFNKLLTWWHADKHYIIGEDKIGFGHSVPEEFRRRFKHLIDILNQVLSLNDFWKYEPEQSIMVELIKDICAHKLSCTALKFTYKSILFESLEGIFQEVHTDLASKETEKVQDACNMIIDFSHLTELRKSPDFLHIIHILTDQIKWRNYDILEPILKTLKYLFRSHARIFNEERIADIIFGLKFLLIETASEMEHVHISKRLLIRKNAAGLAYLLYNHYQDKNATIPETLIEWENIGESDLEFNEIKIEWRS